MELENWDKEPFMGCWVDEIPEGHKEGEKVEIFGYPARLWLRSNAEKLRELRKALP